MSMPLARRRRDSGIRHHLWSGVFMARVSDLPWPSPHAFVFPLGRNSPTAVAPEVPADVGVRDRRCRLGIQNHNPVARGPTIVGGVPDEVVVNACYVLLASVERHVETALLDGAACRDVAMTDPSQTDRPLARVEELRLIKG